MSDGSWRLVGRRKTPGGTWQDVNTFIEQEETFLGVIEAVLPTEAAQRAELQAVINTFQINTDSPLQPAPLSTLSSLTRSRLEILHVAEWTTPAGVFFITGEVANYGDRPVGNVPVRAVLTAAGGEGVAEAVDRVMSYVIPPGEFAPFSLRFGQGQPPEVTGYTLSLGGEDWQPGDLPPTSDSRAFAWTDETSYNENNHLIISGMVTNISENTVRDTRAIVTLFDEAQRVIAAGFAEVDRQRLPPGEKTTYSILVPDIGGTPANYIVDVQGRTVRTGDAE